MKVTEHVEQLLRQGKKPKELLELGFAKQVVTRVRRRLKEERAAQPMKAARGGGQARIPPELPAQSAEGGTAMQQKLASLESSLRELESRIKGLEAMEAEGLSEEDLEARLEGTPALGLKHRFKCGCGASGFVALHVQCTRCGRETWWGWFPRQ